MIRTLILLGLCISLSINAPAEATCIVVLANKTQIAVAADSMARKPNGDYLGETCKIFRFRNFYFVIAGIGKLDLIQPVAQAAQGTKSLEEMQKRFDQLIVPPLQANLDLRLKRVPGYAEQVRADKQVFQIILFEFTPDGPNLFESLYPAHVTKDGKITIDKPLHNICRHGEGECSLLIGTGDEAREYHDKHPFVGSDLIASAEELVRIEATAQPDKVGGNTSMLLIDSAGNHPINMLSGCPLIVTVNKPKR